MNKFAGIILVLLVLGMGWYAWDTLVAKDDGNKKMQTLSDMLGDGSSMETITEDVTYFGTSTRGFYARPKDDGDYPGVVMIHEWWGLNQNIKEMATIVAGEGYEVLAADLYGGKVATSTTTAQEYRRALNQTQATANLRAAVKFLRDRGADEIASLGWCFGGGQSLQLAMSGEPLDATVMYYGTVATSTAQLSRIDWPLLGIFGEKDTSIATTSVMQFKTALTNAQVENEIYIYPNVGHAFANPTGTNYAPSETKDAWMKTMAFLNTHLKGEGR